MTSALKLHAKLAEVMAEAERIPKNGSYKQPGEYGHFKFVQVGDAADAIRTALAKRKVSMLPSAVEVVGESEHATKSGGTMTTLTVRTTWTLVDGETGESAVIQSIGSGADAGDKASPKAQTNAMKYALLMGFLLSTGDDPETSDSSDRRSLAAKPPEPEPTHADGIIGTVMKGKAPSDMEVRVTPDGFAYGFKLAQGRKNYQVLATNSLAEELADKGLKEESIVTVWGRIEMVPWESGGKPRPPFARIHLERMTTAAWAVPGPKRVEKITPDSIDRDEFGLDPIPVAEGQESLFDPAESARIDAEEASRG